MRSAVNDVAAWGAVCAIAAAASAPAAADLGGWVPSLAVTGGVHIQEHTSSVNASCAVGGRGKEAPPPGSPGSTDNWSPCVGHAIHQMWRLRPPDSDTDWAVSPVVGVDLQLMTPTIPRIPGRPRLFARGEIQFAFGVSQNTAAEGEPSEAAPPGEGLENIDFATDALLGLGSRTSSEIQTLGWGAAAGIAFPFRFRGHQLWVKTGAAWTRYSVDVEGLVVSGLKNDPKRGSVPWGPELREITLTGKRSATYDGIGPSLEIEMDVGQFGPIGASLFVGGEVYRVLGNRAVRFSDSESFPEGTLSGSPPYALPADTYTANWSYEVDPWLYRGRVGLRFSWLGK